MKQINITLSFISIFILLFKIQISAQNQYFSMPNRLLFADNLYCQSDYLRAAEEYSSVLKKRNDDTLRFRIGLCYSKIQDYEKAENYFTSINSHSFLNNQAALEILKGRFLLKDLNYFQSNATGFSGNSESDFNRFRSLADLLYTDELPDSNNFRVLFNSIDIGMMNLYREKLNLSSRSPIFASFLSTLVPGLGKIYTGNIGDGITAFLFTGILGYLAFDNFRALHQFRAWLFSGLGAVFYAGNIYGSYASAQIFNARIEFDFKDKLALHLSSRNYFIPDYEFIKCD